MAVHQRSLAAAPFASGPNGHIQVEWVSSCSCGWSGTPTLRKASAASAVGMHIAAALRKENKERGSR